MEGGKNKANMCVSNVERTGERYLPEIAEKKINLGWVGLNLCLTIKTRKFEAGLKTDNFTNDLIDRFEIRFGFV